MKTLLMIFIILPHILLAGWVKEGNGYISQDSLPGQKRFLPAENAVIVENKDFVLKYDLTTGEIIKRIDIVETDTTYKMAVANDDLSQVYLLTENFFQNPNNSNIYFFIVMIKDYNTRKVLHLDTILVTYESTYYSVSMQSYLYFHNQKLFYTIEHGTTTYLVRTYDTSLRVYSAKSKDTLQRVLYNDGKIDSYSLLNTFKNTSYFVNYKYEIRTKGLVYNKYTNDLLNYNDSLNNIKVSFTSNESTSISNIVNGKTSNNFIFGFKGKLILNGTNGKENHILKYGLNTPISFTKDDNYLLVVYPFIDQPYQNAISIQTFDGEVIFRDTIPTNMPRQIIFDDGKTFYLSKNDRLFKYSPEFLKSSNLKAIMKEIKDTLYLGEVLQLYSLSMGSPNEIKWYLDDILVSESQIYDISISSAGNHTIKLVVNNQELIDSISQDVYVEKLDIDKNKALDFEIEILTKNPLVLRFIVPEIYDYNSYYWNFGDGASVAGKKVKYKYQDTGTYSVTLTAIREDGTFVQEIKADVVSSNDNVIDYTKPLFEKFNLRDDKRFYFKPLKSLNNVHIRVFDKNQILLFDEEYKILSKGEINSITPPVDGTYTIQLETSSGEMYEY